MSHIVSIKTQVRDAAAVSAACERLNLAPPVTRAVKLYSSTVTGLAVQLPDWTYPIVCDLASGEVKYDDFEGRWGEKAHFDRFLQMYACEVTKIEARKKGYSVTEQPQHDGSIKLTIQVTGGAA